MGNLTIREWASLAKIMLIYSPDPTTRYAHYKSLFSCSFFYLPKTVSHSFLNVNDSGGNCHVSKIDHLPKSRKTWRRHLEPTWGGLIFRHKENYLPICIPQVEKGSVTGVLLWLTDYKSNKYLSWPISTKTVSFHQKISCSTWLSSVVLSANQ